MNDEGQRRLAHNEALFREVNEGIQRGHWPGDEGAPVGFRCECARIGCNAIVSLPAREYERIRGHPRWFLVLPGHELGEVEKPIERAAGYSVVEKEAEAGRVAAATDPRE
jgi:hypothetical protein